MVPLMRLSCASVLIFLSLSTLSEVANVESFLMLYLRRHPKKEFKIKGRGVDFPQDKILCSSLDIPFDIHNSQQSSLSKVNIFCSTLEINIFSSTL